MNPPKHVHVQDDTDQVWENATHLDLGVELPKEDHMTVREIPAEAKATGILDEHGFLWMNDADFYDPDGYFFEDGVDEFGGRYENYEYVAPAGMHIDIDSGNLSDEFDDLMRNLK